MTRSAPVLPGKRAPSVPARATPRFRPQVPGAKTAPAQETAPRRKRHLLRASLVFASLAAGAGCAQPPPRDGLVVLHEAVPAGRLLGRRADPGTLAPATIVLATSEETEEAGIELTVRVGKLGWTPDGEQPEAPGTNAERRRKAPAPRTAVTHRILPRDVFQMLWSDLLEIGVESLPAHRGSAPPANRSYLVMEAAGRRRIYVRPDPAGTSPEEARELLRTWSAAKLVIVRYVSGY